jgi:biotin carboxyl carrier protein
MTRSRGLRVRPTPASTHATDEPLAVRAADGSLTRLNSHQVRVSPTGSLGAVDVHLQRLPDAAPPVYEVVVEGWLFTLEVEDAARAELLDRARRVGDAGSHDGPIEVRAMIPGRVMSVAVAEGDSVTLGQPLVVVEAMKMQNELRAPRDGVVERIAVAVGKTLEPGEVVVVIR